MPKCADTLLSEGWTPLARSSGVGGASNVWVNSPNYKGKKNRLDSDGNVMKCFHCQPEYHLDKREKQTNKQVEQTMLSSLLSSSISLSLCSMPWLLKRRVVQGVRVGILFLIY